MLSTRSKGNLEGLSIVAVHDQDDLCFGIGGDTATGQINSANLGAIDVCNCLAAFQNYAEVGTAAVLRLIHLSIRQGIPDTPAGGERVTHLLHFMNQHSLQPIILPNILNQGTYLKYSQMQCQMMLLLIRENQ